MAIDKSGKSMTWIGCGTHWCGTHYFPDWIHTPLPPNPHLLLHLIVLHLPLNSLHLTCTAPCVSVHGCFAMHIQARIGPLIYLYRISVCKLKCTTITIIRYSKILLPKHDIVFHFFVHGIFGAALVTRFIPLYYNLQEK